MRHTAILAALVGLSLHACTKETAAPTVDPTPKGVAAAAKDEAKPGSTPGTRDDVDEDGVVRRGAPLSATKGVSVAEALTNVAELDGKPVKVRGTVGKICEKKGCWFVLQEGDENIRITAKDYGFVVPAKSVGMNATVEGELSVKTLSEEDREHLAAEGAAVEDSREVAIVASGLEMTKKEG